MTNTWGSPAPYRGPVSEVVRWLCSAYLALTGWTPQGDWPAVRKAVVVAAPHTSNWDGLNMLAAAGHYRVTLRWMGKESLTRGPFGWLMKALGCVPIDRSARRDTVQAMTDAFAASESMLLVVPPEGTRSLTPEWKSGFYHIARKAKVPIIPAVMDYGSKTIRIAEIFEPTGNYDEDVAAIRTHYRDATGKHPTQFAAQT